MSYMFLYFVCIIPLCWTECEQLLSKMYCSVLSFTFLPTHSFGVLDSLCFVIVPFLEYSFYI